MAFPARPPLVGSSGPATLPARPPISGSSSRKPTYGDKLDWTKIGTPYVADYLVELARVSYPTLTPTVRSVFLKNSTVSWQYQSAVLSKEGYIILSPLHEATLYIVKPSTGEVVAALPVDSTTNKWKGGVLAFDGNVYLIPAAHEAYLKVDTTALSVTEIPHGLGYGSAKSTGGSLAPNGCIYSGPNTPGTYPYIFKFDPATSAFTQIGPTSTTCRCGGLTLAPNGYLYSNPSGSMTQILKIDPATDTFSYITIPSHPSGGFNSVLAPNGKIYSLGTNLLHELDPETDTFTSYSVSGAVSGPIVLGPDGMIYQQTAAGATLKYVDPVARTLTDTGVVLHSVVGTYGGVSDGSGELHFSPSIGSVGTPLHLISVRVTDAGYDRPLHMSAYWNHS